MTTSTVPAVLPGIVRQVGYVLRDIDQAINSWLALGIGPWYVVRGQSQTGLYRGEPCTVTLSIAFSNTGDLQIELIQQEDDAPSIYREFLDSGREGFHQYAWWVEDVDAAVAAGAAAGWPVVWADDGSSATRFAYLEPPPGAPAAIYELMELTPGTTGMAAFVRKAAAEWDGTDPIRSLGA
jgi:hypothetical protein